MSEHRSLARIPTAVFEQLYNDIQKRNRQICALNDEDDEHDTDVNGFCSDNGSTSVPCMKDSATEKNKSRTVFVQRLRTKLYKQYKTVGTFLQHSSIGIVKTMDPLLTYGMF